MKLILKDKDYVQDFDVKCFVEAQSIVKKFCLARDINSCQMEMKGEAALQEVMYCLFG